MIQLTIYHNRARLYVNPGDVAWVEESNVGRRATVKLRDGTRLLVMETPEHVHALIEERTQPSPPDPGGCCSGSPGANAGCCPDTVQRAAR